MGKKCLIISTSLRDGSNSSIIAEAFAKGAKEGGNDVELVSLQNKSISFCKGCAVCEETHKCVIGDDANAIAEKALVADILVFATPIYFGCMSGQMKTVLDRLNQIIFDKFKFREVYLIATSADDAANTMNVAVDELMGWVNSYDDVSLKGVIKGLGLNNSGEASGANAVLEEAYNVGKNA